MYWKSVLVESCCLLMKPSSSLLKFPKATCKRTQQLPTLLGQQWWELLRLCWQWCANRCNTSQQCWDLQWIVGRIQPIRLRRPFVMRVRGPNNVGCVDGSIVALSFGDHGTKEMLGVGSKVWQQLLTTRSDMQMDTTWNIQQCCVRLYWAW